MLQPQAIKHSLWLFARAQLPKDSHIAPALKKIITILLLIVMAGQAVGAFYIMPSSVTCVQEGDDTKESGNKEGKKETKEFLSGSYFFYQALLCKTTFFSSLAVAIPAPEKDQLTPPPDCLFR